MSGLRYLDDVVTLELNIGLCTGCGMCTEVCPHGVFVIENKAVITDRDACIECGACVLNCPAGALSVETGVGCAAAVLSSMAKRNEQSGAGSGDSCCSADSSCC